MCDIIIYKRGTAGERTFTAGERTWEIRGTTTVTDIVIHGIITEMCDIIIYKRGSTGERTFSTGERTWESSVTHGDPDLLRPRIQKIKKTRYQRNVKIFIFSFLCLLIRLTKHKLLARTPVEIQRH